MTAFQKNISLPLPEPSAGIAAYEEELAACLALSPAKQENYNRFRAARAVRSATVDYLPVKLDIENVSRCNFSCTMCAVSTWRKGKRAADMTLECFKRLIDEQIGLVEIKLNGLGEALMQGDDYFAMIRYARERRIWVRMTTNASLLHIKDNAKKLIDSGVNEIDISVDGVDAMTFEGIRIGGHWKTVRDNCKRLNNMLRERGRPSAKMWTLVQRANIHDIHRHVPLARLLGFKHAIFSTSLHGWANDALARRNAAAEVGLTRQQVEFLISQGQEHGVRVAFWDVADKFHAANLCPWPFERAVVTSDSRTVACCMIGDPDKHELGKGQSLLTAWTGEEYRAFRQSHIDGAIPQVCKGCYK